MNYDKPFTVINPDGDSDWLLICEHASCQVPDSLNNLGVDSAILHQHMGYDIGTYNLTQILSRRLNATAVVCNYSRLIIDCNRSLNQLDCIPEISDGIDIPGNQNLSEKDRLSRIEGIYQPFHSCIFHTLTNKLNHNHQLKIANIHSFTPMLATEGKKRPWHIGFAYRNPQPSHMVIDHIRHHTDYCVGDNEPYSGLTCHGYTTALHAESNDLPYLWVEFRQDLINHPDGVLHWADIFAKAMQIVR
ncbi:MAG: N-formylglutamate amidohydrolase [Gammaproteobacteria bacterium]|nr:MAG: N-formylglutamate amidohydrolase [Gammaproteobacteria bacterium]